MASASPSARACRSPSRSSTPPTTTSSSRCVRPFRAWRGAGLLAAIASSLLLLFLVLPVVRLVAAAGTQGAARLWTDAELRQSLALTAITAPAGTLLAALGGAPLAWLLAPPAFPPRA